MLFQTLTKHITTTPDNTYNLVLCLYVASSPLIFIALFIVGSPYGSQTTYKGRLSVPGKLAWVVMELISPISFLLSYQSTTTESTVFSITALLLWMFHYINRALIYPLRQPSRKPMHLGIMLSACLFNSVNGYLNGAAFENTAIQSTRKAVFGFVVFWIGMLGNVFHDEMLMRLRNAGDQKRAGKGKSKYMVPFGGLFWVVSCPHYLCEIIEWTGYALMTGSPAAWAFVLAVICNLVPRAYFIHAWYKNKFEDYPKTRRAIIPYVF